MKSFIRRGVSCLLLALAAVSVQAQDAAKKGALVLRIAKPDGCSAQVAYPSANGEWVTGGVYDGSTYQAYRWNTRNNEFEYLNAYGDFSFGYAVTNSGMVTGEYSTHELLQNGAGIQAPCVWHDGKWHVLDMGTGSIDPELPSAGAARNITPDGKYVVGALCTKMGWTACVWQLDAQAQSSVLMLPMEELGVAEHVSDDGTVIGGFDEARSVRIPAYWTRSAGKYDEVIPDGRTHQGMWTITCGVSPNGSYVATWNKLFDLKKGTSVQVDKETNVDAATVAGVTSTGLVYGSGQILTYDGIDQFAAYFENGKWVNVQSVLEGQGAVIGNGYKLTELRYMSDDGKIFCCNARYPDGLTGAMLIKLDENVTSRPPVALKAMQMGGLKAVRLNWKEPLANAEGVKEYVVLRDGVEIYRGKALQYTDRNCEIGKSYTYTVKASYGTVMSDASDAATIEVTALPVSAPSELMARQAGINNVRLEWEGAGTSLSELKYYTEGREVSGFGGGAWNIETGVRFRSEDLMLYENMEICEVSFWPMSPQQEWTVNFYRASDMSKPVYSETLDATKLVYGSRNNIRLKSPVQIPGDEDLVVGVYAKVKGSSFNVMGLMLGDNEPGYNDLIRQPGEKFVSLYEDGLQNGYEYPYSWPIGLGLSTVGGEIASLTGYYIYQDGQKVSQVAAGTQKAVLRQVADGSHSYAVSAVYTDGQESTTTTTSLSVKRDTKFYVVDDIRITPTGNPMEALVEWKAPMDDERTTLSYSQEKVHHGVHTSAAEGFSFQAASVYSQPMFKQYLGDYQVSGVRFYPLGHAEFALYLNESGKNRWSTELEREVDYDLNAWNTIWLDDPIALNANVSELQLIVDCFDGDAGKDILGMDNMPANANYSDLYSLDDGASWDSYESQTGTRGNWMMGLVITSREPMALPVKNYVLTWDGFSDNSTTVPAEGPLSLKHTFDKAPGNRNKVVITAVYENETWASQPCTIDWSLDANAIVAPEVHVGVTDVYDLQGRKVVSPKRGIYVKDGRKIVR